MRAVGERLGLGGKMFEFLLASHREAVYVFGEEMDELCRCLHGLKEGCVSSPTLFVLIYSIAIIRMSLQVLSSALCPGNMPLGVTPYVCHTTIVIEFVIVI